MEVYVLCINEIEDYELYNECYVFDSLEKAQKVMNECIKQVRSEYVEDFGADDIDENIDDMQFEIWRKYEAFCFSVAMNIYQREIEQMIEIDDVLKRLNNEDLQLLYNYKENKKIYRLRKELNISMRTLRKLLSDVVERYQTSEN